MNKISVLEYLRHMVKGTLTPQMQTYLRYPTAISRTLDLRLIEVDEGYAVLELDARLDTHSNQQGTIHGGLLCELADAAIGTAQSTLISEGESFTSIDIHVSFYRPVFNSTLRAAARPLYRGKTVSHYQCEIYQADGKVAAVATSKVMILRGEKAMGR